MTALLAASKSFVESYHARPLLVAEQAGWTRTIVLHASDTREQVALRVDDGRVVQVEANGGEADLTITATATILVDILELRSSANEAYIFGDIVLRGREADFVRLDYVTTMLGPS